MIKSKQLSIVVRIQIEILFKECYSQKQNAKKLKISRPGVQYLLEKQLETVTNVNRKREGAPKVTTAAEDKHLIIETKRHKRKTASELTGKLCWSQLC